MSEAPFLDGVEEDLVDEAHDRRIFDVVTRDVVATRVVAARDLQVLEIELVLGEVGER
jgi:hypothetical protein